MTVSAPPFWQIRRAVPAVEAALARIEAQNSRLNALLEVYAEEALKKARHLDQLPIAHDLPLRGLIYVHKDNICYAGYRVSAASKILEGFVSPYSATVIERLEAAGAICIGRANCDEFAMGSSNENSAYGPVRNPLDPSWVPGGSSGGSAAAAAAGFCDMALGSDTGGSIRQPAAFCGLYGLKPTYGRVSRYGLIAYASSFDQIGPLAPTLEALIASYGVMAGWDARDATTSRREVVTIPSVHAPHRYALLAPEGMHPIVQARIQSLVIALRKAGCLVEEVAFPYWDYLVPTYYILTTAEASSNLARYDGVRYGHRTQAAQNMETLYARSRSEGFGLEVKRRILLGTFVLSAGYYEAYYNRAQRVRRLVYEYTERLLHDYEVLLMPTSATPPFALGERVADPIQMYLSDILTVYANLTGHPTLQVPLRQGNEVMPVGIQLIGPLYEENRLFSAAYAIQGLEMAGI
jgi:aspartyl-tRNA(Asn)/glutamyl-tRNA(Gln) amidotransferase subunit A